MLDTTSHWRPDPFEMQEKYGEMLNRWSFERFVTLQFNDWRDTRLPAVGRLGHIRKVLRQLDARVNHAILGKYWATSPDRTWAFFVPEKIETSPHWHAVVRFTDEPTKRMKQEAMFDREVTRHWGRLVPSGTVESKHIFCQDGIVEYLLKSVPYALSYEHIILPDEFFRG